ncbi:hypothetical protein RhiirB3_382744 [Rhizophagus irregularis]|nr:hypothetical protein RhiirB3_382744 [Rhizophagus irregularis]
MTDLWWICGILVMNLWLKNGASDLFFFLWSPDFRKLGRNLNGRQTPKKHYFHRIRTLILESKSKSRTIGVMCMVAICSGFVICQSQNYKIPPLFEKVPSKCFWQGNSTYFSQ